MITAVFKQEMPGKQSGVISLVPSARHTYGSVFFGVLSLPLRVA
jgi:hypothetical protein